MINLEHILSIIILSRYFERTLCTSSITRAPPSRPPRPLTHLTQMELLRWASGFQSPVLYHISCISYIIYIVYHISCHLNGIVKVVEGKAWVVPGILSPQVFTTLKKSLNRVNKQTSNISLITGVRGYLEER